MIGQQAIVVVVVASVAIAPLAFAHINEASVDVIELHHEEIIVEHIVLRRVMSGVDVTASLPDAAAVESMNAVDISDAVVASCCWNSS